ncbi:hypothetical protein GN956_G11669 [Arapaima gigas]
MPGRSLDCGKKQDHLLEALSDLREHLNNTQTCRTTVLLTDLQPSSGITAIHPAGIERRWRDVATPRLFGTNKALLLHLEKKPFPANTPQPARDLLDVPCYTSNLQKILTFNLRAHQIPG